LKQIYAGIWTFKLAIFSENTEVHRAICHY
jgi:hypothetical protein